MARCLLVGEAREARPLRRALDAVGVECAAVGRPVETEQAVRTSRASLVIVGDDFRDLERLSRLRRVCPDRLLVGWLVSPSTGRAAELLECGCVEVLGGAMGERELVARLRHLLERQPPWAVRPVELGPLSVDAGHGEASWGGLDLKLTGRERELLQALVEAAPRTVRRDELYRRVWGFAMARGDRTVDVNVRRLRAKLRAVTTEARIATEPGVGYRLELLAAKAAVTGL